MSQFLERDKSRNLWYPHVDRGNLGVDHRSKIHFLARNRRIITRDLASMPRKLSGAWLSRLKKESRKLFTNDFLNYRVNTLPESLNAVSWPKQMDKCTSVCITFITEVRSIREHSPEAKGSISCVKEFKVLFVYRDWGVFRKNHTANLVPIYGVKPQNHLWHKLGWIIIWGINIENSCVIQELSP